MQNDVNFHPYVDPKKCDIVNENIRVSMPA